MQSDPRNIPTTPESQDPDIDQGQDPDVIWLSPSCELERTWCTVNAWPNGCEQCGARPVRYIRDMRTGRRQETLRTAMTNAGRQRLWRQRHNNDLRNATSSATSSEIEAAMLTIKQEIESLREMWNELSAIRLELKPGNSTGAR